MDLRIPRRFRLLRAPRRVITGAGLIASCLAASLPARAGTACPPAAIVEGAAEIVTPVAAVLRRRGLRSEPSGCGRVVRASLAARPDLKAYSLHIEDGYGRVSDREIADASTAASLIESWTIDEDADVLAPRPAPVTIERAPVAGLPRAAAAPAAFRVMTLGEIMTGTDGSLWYGGALAACGRIGSICLGGRARIARDGGDGGGGLPGTLTRSRIDAGAVAFLPLSRGAFTFSPMLGLGMVWTRSALNAMLWEPSSMLEMSTDDLSLGAEAGLTVARTVTQHLSVVGELGGIFSRPVSSRGMERPAAFLPLPPDGLVRVAIGLQYAR
jgi:hypothetical protein